MDMEYFKKNDILNDIEGKKVRDYYKVPAQKDFEVLYAVKDPLDESVIISLSREKKWSPFSERGRLHLGYFRHGEPFPYIVTVSDMDYDTEAAEKELITMAEADKDFKSMMKRGLRFDIEDYLSHLDTVPYIIPEKHDLKKIADMAA